MRRLRLQEDRQHDIADQHRAEEAEDRQQDQRDAQAADLDAEIGGQTGANAGDLAVRRVTIEAGGSGTERRLALLSLVPGHNAYFLSVSAVITARSRFATRLSSRSTTSRSSCMASVLPACARATLALVLCHLVMKLPMIATSG